MDKSQTAVKILEQNDDAVIVGGYGVVFGGRDLEGETFTAETDFQLERVPVKAVYYDHSQNAKVSHVIGNTISETIDETGIWVQAQIERAAEYAEEVIKLVEAGLLGWSSGSVVHLVRGRGGTLKSWPIFEYSLTPTPAEPRTVGVERLKALVESDPALKAMLAEIAQESDSQAASDGEGDTEPTDNKEPETRESVKMTDEVKDVVPALTLEQITGAIDAAVKANVEPLAERLRNIEDKPVAAPAVATKEAPAVHLNAEYRKYDNYDAADLGLAIDTLNEMKRVGKSRRGASGLAYKALAMRLESDEVRKDDNLLAASFAMKAAGVKANELNQSTLANYGDEWVGVAYSGQMWEQIRHATFMLQNLPAFEAPAGAESGVFPLESTDPTWYKVGQAADISANPGGVITNTVTASHLGTAANTWTLGKMGARQIWTGEMEEDSLLPYVAQLRNQLVMSGAEYVEAAIIDGDTETAATTNINDIADTPGGSEYFMILNGLRKSPLVTTTANSRDGGALAIEDYLETVKLMGSAGKNALDRSKVAFIVDPSTHWKALQLAEVKTQDVFSGATIEGGMITKIWGYPQYISAHMCKGSGTGLSNTAGKVDLNTGGNNTKGQILAVRWDQWRFVWRRRMTIETTRVAAADATEIVALMRFGLTQRDTEASAITYNLTV